jgi:hypothetical protein
MQSRSFISKLTSVIVYMALLIMMVQLLVFHLQPGAPLWRNQSPHSGQLFQESGLAVMDKRFLDVAAGGNLELHFVDFNVADFHTGLAMGQFYFRCNYALYPHRALVGRGDQIINSPVDLAASDIVPDDSWLRQHDVHAVRTLIETPLGADEKTRQVH